ncbi:MAG: PKD domain-containing protein [Candidatus Limivicinus sp.]|jgi:hypothetical protein
MKNKYIRLLLTAVIAVALVLAMAVPAFATAIPMPTLSIKQDFPEQISLNSGQVYTFNVSVSGADNPTYQWYFNNDKIPGANGSSYSFVASATGSYHCQVDASGQSARSTDCLVTVTGAAPTTPPATPKPTAAPSVKPSAPVITGQPSSANLLPGQSVTLSVSATCDNLGSGMKLGYQWFSSDKNDGSNCYQIPGATSSSYTTQPDAGNKYYFVGIWSTNGNENSSVVYSNVVSVSYGSGVFKITKQPTGETVDAGGSALFIAKADNAKSHVWRIVSKDTTQTVTAKEAPGFFRGLNVSGADTDTLALSNIPASMDGWSVECKFTGNDGSVLFTNGAVIRVKNAQASKPAATAKPGATPKPGTTAKPEASSKPATAPAAVAMPTINTQPVGAVLSEGETTTLSVAASSADKNVDVSLKYQWYRNDKNSNANGTAIAGAQSETYVPDTISGSKYYYVGVWASDGTHTSKVTYSSPVAVTYTAPIGSETQESDEEDEENEQSHGIGSMVIAPVIAMVVAAIAIGIGVFFLLKNLGGKKKSGRKNGTNYKELYDKDEFGDEDDEDDDSEDEDE